MTSSPTTVDSVEPFEFNMDSVCDSNPMRRNVFEAHHFESRYTFRIHDDNGEESEEPDQFLSLSSWCSEELLDFDNVPFHRPRLRGLAFSSSSFSGILDLSDAEESSDDFGGSAVESGNESEELELEGIDNGPSSSHGVRISSHGNDVIRISSHGNDCSGFRSQGNDCSGFRSQGDVEDGFGSDSEYELSSDSDCVDRLTIRGNRKDGLSFGGDEIEESEDWDYEAELKIGNLQQMGSLSTMYSYTFEAMTSQRLNSEFRLQLKDYGVSEAEITSELFDNLLEYE